jgi:hypothetical protein
MLTVGRKLKSADIFSAIRTFHIAVPLLFFG